MLFHKIIFILVSSLLIWSIIRFSIICGNTLVRILRYRESYAFLSVILLEFLPLFMGVICGIVVTIKYWKTYLHNILLEKKQNNNLSTHLQQQNKKKSKIFLYIIICLSVAIIIIWSVIVLFITIFFDCFTIGKTTEDILLYINCLIPEVIILLCNLYVIYFCFKEIYRIITS